MNNNKKKIIKRIKINNEESKKIEINQCILFSSSF